MAETMTIVEKHFASQMTQAKRLSENSTLVHGKRNDLLGTQFKQGDQCVYFQMFSQEKLHLIIHALNVRSFPKFAETYVYVEQSEMQLESNSLPVFAMKK